MSGLPPHWQAFSAELFKLADGYKTFDTIEQAKKRIKPGDILVTQPRDESKLSIFDKLLRRGLIAFQGTPYTHTGLVSDDGNVIDSGTWKRPKEITKGVAKIPLEEYAERYKFKILRVRDATKKDLTEAVTYAKEQVGKPFDVKGMFRLALPVSKDPQRKREREEAASKFFCSQLVANAFSKFPFAKHRHIRHVRPVDIQRSPLTKTIAVFDPEG